MNNQKQNPNGINNLKRKNHQHQNKIHRRKISYLLVLFQTVQKYKEYMIVTVKYLYKIQCI